MDRSDSIERKAEKIASQMYERNLQPWHVAGELENRAIPEMYREELEKKVAEELRNMYGY